MKVVATTILAIAIALALGTTIILTLPRISESDSASTAFWKLVDPDRITMQDIRWVREVFSLGENDSTLPSDQELSVP